VTFQETLLTEQAIPQSNQILLNGILLAEILEGAKASENACGSCSELLGVETSCRTIHYNGQIHEAIPTNMIRTAACKVIGCA
jgi:hypothetical protein